MMTPELHAVCVAAGPETVAWLSRYLDSPVPDAEYAAVRQTLAEVLAEWSAAASPEGVDPRLVAAVGPLAAAPAGEGARTPTFHRLMIADAEQAEGPAALLARAAWREVDAALWAAKLA